MPGIRPVVLPLECYLLSVDAPRIETLSRIDYKIKAKLCLKMSNKFKQKSNVNLGQLESRFKNHTK